MRTPPLPLLILLCGLMFGPSASATVRKVPTNYPTLRAAINAAVSGDTILLLDGTYTGPNNNNLEIVGKSLEIRSAGSAATCVIDGYSPFQFNTAFTFSGNASASSIAGITFRHCQKDGIRILGSTLTVTDCVFDNNSVGLTLEDGALIVTGSTFQSNFGGGVYAFGTAAISGCAFDNNAATSGGGLCVGGAIQVQNCTFTGNRAESAGGGVYHDGGALTLENCVFTNNTASQGGGASVFGSVVSRIANCEFNGNRAANGGGAEVSGDVDVERCRFTHNTALSGLGGGLWIRFNSALGSGFTIVWNSLFTANQASYGGGIAVATDFPIFSNCTLSGNSAVGIGGGLYMAEDCHPYLTSSLLWGNTAQAGSEIGGGNALPWVEYCDVQHGYPGTGNIDADPMFVDTAHGDFHLQTASPCIDVATNEPPIPASTDLEGNPRVYGSRADIGAYEVQTLPTSRLSGTVSLEDIVSDAPPQSLTFTFTPLDDPEPILRTVPIGPEGAFLITDLRRTDYSLHVKGAKWLATNGSVSASGGGVINMTVTLRAGDANNDNSVDLLDLDLLIQAFDSSPNTPHWNENTDFNCDESADLLDLDLLLRNFDVTGAP